MTKAVFANFIQPLKIVKRIKSESFSFIPQNLRISNLSITIASPYFWDIQVNISTNIQQVINLQDARFIKDLAKSLMILIIISIAEE